MNEERTHEKEWDEENRENYDATLHNLVIDFLQDVNLPFSTVENPRFREILKYLNPIITPPTLNSIMFTATNTQELEAIPVSDTEVALVPPLKLGEFPSEDDIFSYLNGITYSKGTTYVCMVCMKENDWEKVRKVTANEKSIFLYVCVAEGVYSMETAQNINKMSTPLRCCADHYSHVCDALMKRLKVTTVEDLISCGEKEVTDVFFIVKKIKNPIFEGSEMPQLELFRGLGTFRYTLRCFSKKHFLPPSELQTFHTPINPNTTISEYLLDQHPPSKVKRVEQSFGNGRPGEETFPDDFLVFD